MAGAGKLGILVGGGPAPGINSVIGAATIRSLLEGIEVIGIKDGFDRIMRGATQEATLPLGIDKVSRLHFRGGSLLGISRANPTKDPKHMEAARQALERLGITMLITIGGDDTAFSSMKLSEAAGGKLRVAHVPKTIDNDLDLPPHIDTFGFQTARHWGVELVKNLMVDAYTTSRWYIVVSMGRKAGHLALGIGKAVGATVTLISEEFAEGMPLKLLVDTLAMSVVKRLATGRRDGVAVVAEGLVLSIDPRDLAGLENVERDEHGHVRLSEVDIGEILKQQVSARLTQLGLKATLVSKNIGYELRCADPIPYDMEYTRDLGYCAAKYLLSGGDKAMVSIQGGRFVPVPFKELIDPKTGRAKVRLVDIHSDRYAIARRYMIRLRRDDFEDAEMLGRMAAIVSMTPQELRKQFEYIVQSEPPPLHFST